MMHVEKSILFVCFIKSNVSLCKGAAWREIECCHGTHFCLEKLSQVFSLFIEHTLLDLDLNISYQLRQILDDGRLSLRQ